MSISNVVRMIEDNDVRFVDLRFTDTKGKQHHFTVPAAVVLDDPEEWFENGHPFDGSSIGGWKGVQASDMLLRPDPATAFIDPFYDDATVVLTCDVIDPAPSCERLEDLTQRRGGEAPFRFGAPFRWPLPEEGVEQLSRPTMFDEAGQLVRLNGLPTVPLRVGVVQDVQIKIPRSHGVHEYRSH